MALVNVVFGFFAELNPVLQKRCKYYLIAGACVSGGSLLTLSLIGNPSYNQVRPVLACATNLLAGTDLL